MQMLHNGPYRAQPAQHSFGVTGRRFFAFYLLALKLVLIACVTAVFFQLIAFLLTLSNSGWMQIVALLAWSCGAVPLVYLLWRLDFRGASAPTQGERSREHIAKANDEKRLTGT